MKIKSALTRYFILSSSIAAVFAPLKVKAATYYWDTNGATPGSGSATGNWDAPTTRFTLDSTGSTAVVAPGFTTTNADDVVFSAGTNGTAGTVTLTGTRAARSLTFDDPVNIVVTGSTLNLGDASGPSGLFFTANGANTVSTSILLNSGTIAFNFTNNATTNQLISGTVTGAAAGAQVVTLGNTSTGRLILSGVIANGAGGGSVGLNINSSGAGIVVLSGTNTFTGGTTLTAGTLSLNANGSLGAANAANTLTINGGTLDNTATGVVTLSNNPAVNINASVTFAGTRSLSLGTGAVSLATGAVITANSNAALAARATASGVLTLGGIVSGSGGLTKAGNGTLSLSNTANAFTGGITVTGGALRLAAAGSGLTNNNVALNGGVLEIGFTPLAVNLGTGSNQVNFLGDGGFSASGAARVATLNGGAALTWGTTANFVGGSNVLRFGSQQSDNALTLTNAINLGGATRTIDVTRGTNANVVDGILSGAITNGSLTKTGTGSLQLSNAAAATTGTLTGTTTVSGGTLILQNLGATIANTNVVLNGGALGLNADFTAALGTGLGQVSFAGGTAAGGFSAFGANRTVNIGGAGATLVFDSTADFLDTGALVLSSSSSNNTTILTNGLDFNGADRTIQVEDGNSGDDARIDGVISGSGSLIKTGGAVGGGGRLVLSATNTYTGSTVLRQGEILVSNSVLSGVNGPLGNSTSAIIIGDSGTLSAQDNNSGPLSLYARAANTVAGDSQNFVIDRGLDLSQAASALIPTPNVVTGLVLGRYRIGLFGNNGSGLDTSTLTLAGPISLGTGARPAELYVERNGQTLNVTGDVTGSGSATLYLTGASGGGVSATDGRTNGTFRFSNLARTFANTISVTFGTLIIEGSVAASGASPIGTATPAFSDGSGGNVIQANGRDGRRGLFLETPGATYARGIGPGGGSTVTPGTTAGQILSSVYGTGGFNVINGHRFGSTATSGTTTFSGAITAANVNTPVTGSAAGSGGSNPFTVVHNFALSAEAGATANFTGAITGSLVPVLGSTATPGAAFAANNARVTINQFRNHPNLDENFDGTADAGLADALVGVATTGTVILSAVNTYGSTTEVLGGTLLVNGSITGTTATVAAGAILGGSGSILAGGAGSVLNVSGIVSPGAAAAGTGNLTSAKPVNFLAGSSLNLQLNGATVGTGYDRMTVAAAASISLDATSTINLTLGYAPAENDLLTIIDNQSAGAFGTTFSNLADDSLVTLNFSGTDYSFFANYQGGTGNDLTLLAIPEPGTAVSLIGGLGVLLGWSRRRRK